MESVHETLPKFHVSDMRHILIVQSIETSKMKALMLGINEKNQKRSTSLKQSLWKGK